MVYDDVARESLPTFRTFSPRSAEGTLQPPSSAHGPALNLAAVWAVLQQGHPTADLREACAGASLGLSTADGPLADRRKLTSEDRQHTTWRGSCGSVDSETVGC